MADSVSQMYVHLSDLLIFEDTEVISLVIRVYRYYDCLFLFQICLAHKSCMGYNLDINWLRKCGHYEENATYSFEEFCCILTEYHSQKKSLWKRFLDVAKNVLPSGSASFNSDPSHKFTLNKT